MVAPTKHIAAAAALLAATSLALAGCSGSGDDSPSASGSAAAVAGSGSASASGSKSAAAKIDDAGISPKDLAVPPNLTAVEGARRDFTMDGNCDTKLGEQKVTGTLKSSAKEPKDYVIVVNWVHGSDVMGRAVKLVEQAPPGKDVKVELTTKLEKAADGCTVNVTRGKKA